jgi:hypothetical protein
VEPPNLDTRRELTLDELCRMEEPVVIHEGEFIDSDKQPYHLYTIAGKLDGQEVAGNDGFSILGCTVAGDAIIISGAKSRAEADDWAVSGLDDTIRAHKAQLDKDKNRSIIVEGHRTSRRLH